jgi:hypothetical protein
VTAFNAWLFVISIVLFVLAAFGVGLPRVNLALLGFAFFVLAFAWPGIAVLPR